MRPITSFTLHAILAAALTAFAATSAAAADIYLKLSDPKGELAGGGQIEIASFHWGPRQTTSADGSYADLKLQPGGGGGGAAQGGVQVAAGDLDGDGRSAPVKSAIPKAEVVSPRDTASGQASGKRQHRPVTITKEWENSKPAVTEKRQHGWVTVSKPIEKGSLSFRGQLPGCAVGTSYPRGELVTPTARYELQNILISGCAADSVSLNYAKVKVRGWNPETKEE